MNKYIDEIKVKRTLDIRSYRETCLHVRESHGGIWRRDHILRHESRIPKDWPEECIKDCQNVILAIRDPAPNEKRINETLYRFEIDKSLARWVNLLSGYTGPWQTKQELNICTHPVNKALYNFFCENDEEKSRKVRVNILPVFARRASHFRMGKE